MSLKPSSPDIDTNSEDAWVSVIHKMDEAYTELVQSQVALEQKNVELEEARSFFHSIEDSMSDLLIVCDQNAVIQRVNRALEAMTGRYAKELIGQPLHELISPPYQAKLEQCLHDLRIKPVRDCEIELAGREGSVPLAINCSPRTNHRGRLVGMVLVGRPLGELQTAYKELNAAHDELQLTQERLVHSEKMASLGRLVAGVAHELNNPISFVYGNMHALQRYTARLNTYFNAINEGCSREELREMREQMRLDKAIRDLQSLVEGTMEGADRVKEIVNDLRQFSSTQVAEMAPFDLTHVIRTALHWVTKESRTPVQIELQLPEQLKAMGVSGQIHQVMVNLFQNAIDAMEATEPKSLEIIAEPIGQQVRVQVRDGGPGIPAETLSRVFDPFYTTKPVGQGTGLGLSISYGIVSEHEGVLSIENHPEGGALATLILQGVEEATS